MTTTTAPTVEPIPVRTTRFRCPHCPRTASTRTRARTHMARCWYNPAARGCKTCQHFDFNYQGDEGCALGVDLTGRPACEGCGGYGWADTNTGASKPCGPTVSRSHVGDGREVKSGPITGCEKWEPETGEDTAR